jgi:hypothetical protein
MSTDMKGGFADVVYVVSATKNGQLEFWACANPGQEAAAQVQQLLPPWMDGKIYGLAP